MDHRIRDTFARWGRYSQREADAEYLFKTWEQFDEFCRALQPNGLGDK